MLLYMYKYIVHILSILNWTKGQRLKHVAGMEALSVEAHLIHTLHWLVGLVWLRPEMEALRPKPCFDHGLLMGATMVCSWGPYGKLQQFIPIAPAPSQPQPVCNQRILRLTL